MPTKAQYSRVPLWRGPIYYDIAIGTAMAAAERKSDFKRTTLSFCNFITIDTQYLALMGEIWGVYCDEIAENVSRYNGTALYLAKRRLGSLTLYLSSGINELIMI